MTYDLFGSAFSRSAYASSAYDISTSTKKQFIVWMSYFKVLLYYIKTILLVC